MVYPINFTGYFHITKKPFNLSFHLRLLFSFLKSHHYKINCADAISERFPKIELVLFYLTPILPCTMQISIIIPTYNRPDLLKQCLHSCLNQTTPPTEIIIGDDSKDDLSKNLVEEIKKSSPAIRIEYFKNSPSKGQIGNVNFLIEKVTSDYTILIHDDDYLLPNCISDLSAPLKKDPTLDASFGKQYLVDMEDHIDEQESEGLNQAYYRIPEFVGSKLSSYESGILQQFPNNGYLIKSEVIKNNHYSEQKEMVGDACDFYFGFNLGIKGHRFYFVDTYTAAYRVGNEKVSNQDRVDTALKSYLLIEDHDAPPSMQSVKDKQLNKNAPIALMQAIRRKEGKIARSIFFSKYHLSHLLSPGGIKRTFLLLKLTLLGRA